MWTSAKELLRGIGRHWVQLAGGGVVAVIGLGADAIQVEVPAWIWMSLALGFIGWAVLLAYHDLRLQCDAALDGLADKRNARQIADVLTERHAHGVHELLHKAPAWPTTHNEKDTFQTESFKWTDAITTWNDEVKATMIDLGCTHQEISYFWTIDEVRPGMILRGNDWERFVRLHATRIERLWEIIVVYAKKADLAPGTNPIANR